MARCPSADADRYFAAEEEWHERACVECAEANGHCAAEAEACDDGSVGCRACPFLPR
jgi:hypothetical protein